MASVGPAGQACEPAGRACGGRRLTYRSRNGSPDGRREWPASHYTRWVHLHTVSHIGGRIGGLIAHSGLVQAIGTTLIGVLVAWAFTFFLQRKRIAWPDYLDAAVNPDPKEVSRVSPGRARRPGLHDCLDPWLTRPPGRGVSGPPPRQRHAGRRPALSEGSRRQRLRARRNQSAPSRPSPPLGPIPAGGAAAGSWRRPARVRSR